MTAYQTGQEFNALRWGVMPVALMVGGTFAQVRARGTFSAVIADPKLLAEALPDAEALPRYLQNLLGSTMTDTIGERSAVVTTLEQLTALTPETVQVLEHIAQARFAAIGMRLTDVQIEAIESV
jgi:membrane protease subunit (stomatin/prohibitin family)